MRRFGLGWGLVGGELGEGGEGEGRRDINEWRRVSEGVRSTIVSTEFVNIRRRRSVSDRRLLLLLLLLVRGRLEWPPPPRTVGDDMHDSYTKSPQPTQYTTLLTCCTDGDCSPLFPPFPSGAGGGSGGGGKEGALVSGKVGGRGKRT